MNFHKTFVAATLFLFISVIGIIFSMDDSNNFKTGIAWTMIMGQEVKLQETDDHRLVLRCEGPFLPGFSSMLEDSLTEEVRRIQNSRQAIHVPNMGMQILFVGEAPSTVVTDISSIGADKYRYEATIGFFSSKYKDNAWLIEPINPLEPVH